MVGIGNGTDLSISEDMMRFQCAATPDSWLKTVSYICRSAKLGDLVLFLVVAELDLLGRLLNRAQQANNYNEDGQG